MKLFEEFINADYEMQQILYKLENRIKYWFQNGEFAMSATPVSSDLSSTPNAAKKSIITNFNDSDFYYQMIIKMYIEDLKHCDLIIKKYDPTKIDEIGGGVPIDTLSLTNDKQIEINKIKEDFILKKISDMKTGDENPDDEKIVVPDEKKEEAPVGAPSGEAPEAGGPFGM